MIGMVYSISGCFPSSGAATMNTLTNRISAGPGRPRVSGSRCSVCGLCTGDYEESAGVPKGVVVCADAAWMCCDDPVGVPEELLPRGELRVATQRRYPPLQDGHRGRKVGGDVDVARQVLYYYRPVNRVPPGTPERWRVEVAETVTWYFSLGIHSPFDFSLFTSSPISALKTPTKKMSGPVTRIPRGFQHLVNTKPNKFAGKTPSRFPHPTTKFVQPYDRIRKWNIRPGDRVRLVTGKPKEKYRNEETAEEGYKVYTVKQVDLARNWVFLEGIHVCFLFLFRFGSQNGHHC